MCTDRLASRVSWSGLDVPVAPARGRGGTVDRAAAQPSASQLSRKIPVYPRPADVVGVTPALDAHPDPRGHPVRPGACAQS